MDTRPPVGSGLGFPMDNRLPVGPAAAGDAGMTRSSGAHTTAHGARPTRTTGSANDCGGRGLAGTTRLTLRTSRSTRARCPLPR